MKFADNIKKRKKDGEIKYNEGRTRIDSINRIRFSKRAMDGRLEIIRKNFICKRCNHHKAFKTIRGIKCTKCGLWEENGI